jgi:hypothetical protein
MQPPNGRSTQFGGRSVTHWPKIHPDGRTPREEIELEGSAGPSSSGLESAAVY